MVITKNSGKVFNGESFKLTFERFKIKYQVTIDSRNYRQHWINIYYYSGND